MRKIGFICITFVLTFLNVSNFHLFARGSAGSEYILQNRFIITRPTAGIPEKNSFAANLIIMNQGAVLFDFDISFIKDLSLGLSYSSSGLIGDDKIFGQGLPGLQLKYRLINERNDFPAVFFGWSNQGRGRFNFSNNQFYYSSPGFYIGLSKTYKWFAGNLSLHGGVNYSIESSAKERLPNMFFGLDQSLYKTVSVCAEFVSYFEKFREIDNPFSINASLRWSFLSNLTLELCLIDMSSNFSKKSLPERNIGLEFIHKF